MAPTEKVKRKTCMQFRCSVPPMMKTMQLLKESHLQLLQKTPFWPLLEAFLNGTISYKGYRTPTLNIFQTFNPKTARFHFGTRAVAISTEDISEILGLPQHGEVVHFVTRYKSDFTERHFKGSVRIWTHKLLHNLLLKMLNGKEQVDIEDVVRLTLMELFTTFLFARCKFPMSLLKYCDEYMELSRYSWAEAVGKFLNTSLKKHTMSEVNGCVLLIPFWFCEKTNITKPIRGRGIVEGRNPSLIKWSLEELEVKMQGKSISEIEVNKKERKRKGKELNQQSQKEIGKRNYKMSPAEKVKRKPYMQFHCSVPPMMQTMQLLKESHLQLLQKTPFWPLLEAFRNGTISYKGYRTPTLNIFQTFNPKTARFHFGTRAVAISTEDISQILGLPQHGEVVQFFTHHYKSDFTKRHFEGSLVLNHTLLHGLLLELLNGKELMDIEDVVRLTLMELFLTFLFAQSCFPKALLKYCDEYRELSRYSWAEAVGKFLNTSLKRNTVTHVYGCALLIPFWFCEITNITEPISGKEVVEGLKPSLTKWSLEELKIKMQGKSISEIEAVQRLFEEQNGVEVETKCENKKHERVEEKVNKKEKKRKGKELNQQSHKNIGKRRKFQPGYELLDVENNLEDKLEAERNEDMKLIKKDQLVPQCSSAVQLSPEIDLSRMPHQRKVLTNKAGVRVRKQQLDPDYVCDVVPKMKRKATRQHVVAFAESSRVIQDQDGKGNNPIIIIDDDSVSQEGKTPWKEKRPKKECFPFERSEVFKLLDDEYQQKVKAFWNMANPMELFWNGKNASVAREDVRKLIQDTAVSTNVIDSFIELLEHHNNRVRKATYISTMCWQYVQVQDGQNRGKKNQVQDSVRAEVVLNHLVFDRLLKSLADIDYVFFPIIAKFHYSLLVLNINEKKWIHYNPLRKRSKLHIDPCYEFAKRMHQLVQKWLHTTQKEAQQNLQRGTKRKMTGKKEGNWTEVPLSEDEKRTLIWMMDRNIDFEIQNDFICPQQDYKSLDCGVFVMYYMNQLSRGLHLEEEISECRLWEFRSHLIELFLDDENSWKQNSANLL